MRAIQADDFSIPPYWFESITGKIACLRYFSIINVLATLEITGVSEMGLRSLLISLTGLVLGMVITLALFQLVGTVSSLNEQLRIDEIGVARKQQTYLGPTNWHHQDQIGFINLQLGYFAECLGWVHMDGLIIIRGKSMVVGYWIVVLHDDKKLIVDFVS